MTEQPNYFSIIPANVRYDKRLTPNAKLLYAEITALTQMNGRCFATNAYFAELYGVSIVSISKWIKQLIEYGYVESVIEYKEDTKEILHRYISLVKYPIKENFNTPIKEKLKDNNTTNVDINNNLTDSNKKEKLDFGEYKEVMEIWLEYKKEKKQMYKSNKSILTCFNHLKKISNNDVKVAERIIEAAIAKNYAGFFPLNGKQTSGESTFDRNVRITQEMLMELDND